MARLVTDHRLRANRAKTLERERHRMTLDALADVDACRTVEHGKIEAWAKGLGKPKRERGS